MLIFLVDLVGTSISDIFEELNGKVDYIIDGGNCQIGLESTVVKVINNVPHILRPGKITPEQIKNVCGDVFVDKYVLEKYNSSEKVESPGVQFRHYAPSTKCILVYSQTNDKLVNKIKEIATNSSNPIIISSTENKDKYNSINCTVLEVGSKFNLDEISKNIFSTLRKVDKYNSDLVIIEGVEKSGLGLAIMNRLIRACEYNFIEV